MSVDPSFHMTVVDVYNIRGRGPVVIGQIESGTLRIYDIIYIRGPSSSEEAVVTGIEASGKVVKRAHTGAIVGVILRGSGKQGVQPGDVLMGLDTEFS